MAASGNLVAWTCQLDHLKLDAAIAWTATELMAAIPPGTLPLMKLRLPASLDIRTRVDALRLQGCV